MPDTFGLSFAPLNQNALQQGRGTTGTPGVGGGPSPVQDAIQILNLKIPRVVGGSPVAPAALLNGQGGSGLGAQGDIDALLRQLFGQPLDRSNSNGGNPLGSLFHTFYGQPAGPFGEPSDPSSPPMGPSRPPSPNIGVTDPTGEANPQRPIGQGPISAPAQPAAPPMMPGPMPTGPGVPPWSRVYLPYGR